MFAFLSLNYFWQISVEIARLILVYKRMNPCFLDFFFSFYAVDSKFCIWYLNFESVRLPQTNTVRISIHFLLFYSAHLMKRCHFSLLLPPLYVACCSPLISFCERTAQGRSTWWPSLPRIREEADLQLDQLVQFGSDNTTSKSKLGSAAFKH